MTAFKATLLAGPLAALACLVFFSFAFMGLANTVFLIMGAFVLGATGVLAYFAFHPGAMAALWLVAVSLTAYGFAQLGPGQPGNAGFAVVGGLMYGSVLVGAWLLLTGLLRHVFTRKAERVNYNLDDLHSS